MLNHHMFSHCGTECNVVYAMSSSSFVLQRKTSKHAEKVENAKLIVGKSTPILRGKRGRPSRSSGTNSTSNQTHLHSFFKHEGDGNEEGEFLTRDRSDLFQYMCWGFRGPFCSYARKTYEVMRLLHDSIPGLKWFPKPYIKGKILMNGDLVDVEG